MIDWKTSKKVKSRLQYTYDNPLQLAAYVGALNFDENHMLKVFFLMFCSSRVAPDCIVIHAIPWIYCCIAFILLR